MRRLDTRSENGIAMIMTLLALLVLSTLAASAALLTQTQVWNSVNYTISTQARYASEAGLQKSVNWMIYTYTPPASIASFDTTKSPVQYNNKDVVLSGITGVASNYPDATVKTAFQNGLGNQKLNGMGTPANFSAKATLLTIRSVVQIDGTPGLVQIWRLNSVGNLTGGRGAQVEVAAILETPTLPAVNFAAFGTDTVCSTVDLSGNATTDSFDSSLGSYTATRLLSDGDVGSNGNISLGGTSTHVYGNVSSPLSPTVGSCSAPAAVAVTTSGGANYTGQLSPLSEALSFKTPSAPNPLPPTTNHSISGGNPCNGISGCSATGNDISLVPDSYGNVSVGGGKKLHLIAGTYVFNSVDLSSNNTELIVDSGPITIKLAGQSLGSNPVWNMVGGAALRNPLSRPKDLMVVYGGTAELKLTGGATTYAVVYAPSAIINANGGSDWYGALIGKRVSLAGGMNLHYDRSLINDVTTVENLRPISFSWSKY